MGTLYDQRPRDYKKVTIDDIDFSLGEIVKLSKKHKVSLSDTIELVKVLEMGRQNDLYVYNGDTHDEQMSGIGKELSEISSGLTQIAEALEMLKDSE